MKQAKNHEMINVKTDLANFLHFYLSQTMSLEEMDEWAKRLQKKWDLKICKVCEEIKGFCECKSIPIKVSEKQQLYWDLQNAMEDQFAQETKETEK